MAYDTDVPVLPDEHILSRRPWYLVGVLLIGLSLLFQQPLLIVAGLLVIALGAVPELWYRFCLTDVHVRRTFSTRRAEIGDEVILTLVVENDKLLPLPRLDIEDEVPEEGLAIRGALLETSVKPLRLILLHTLSLWMFQRVTRRYRMRCLQRGVYAFGPLRLKSGDPFGLLTRERTEERTERLLVYPLVVPLERLGLPARAPLGERPAPRRLLEDPLRVGGVRDYLPGDEPRRIHWKATARAGSLQSKVFEPTTHHTLALVVDLRTYDNPVLGYDPDLLELTICGAASVAAWGIAQGYAVGAWANGILTDISGSSSGEDSTASSLFTPSARSLPEAQPRRGSADHVPTNETPSPRDYDTDDIALQRAIRQAQLHLALPPSTDPQQSLRIQEALARLVPYYAAPITVILSTMETRLPYGSTVVYVGATSGLGAEGFALLRRMRSRGHAVVLLVAGDAQVEDPQVDARGLTVRRIGNAQTWQTLLDEALALHGVDRRGRPRPGETNGNSAAADDVSAAERPLAHGPMLEVRA